MIRFGSLFQPKSAAIHSNGMANVGSNNSVGASTSAESFTARQQIDQNRQFIDNFQQANVVQDYKKEAALSNNPEGDWEKRHRERLERQRHDGRPHPQQAPSTTSRVDIVKPARMDGRGMMYDRAGNRIDQHGNTFDRVTGRQLNHATYRQTPRPQTIQRPGGVGVAYSEPAARRYNPYA